MASHGKFDVASLQDKTLALEKMVRYGEEIPQFDSPSGWGLFLSPTHIAQHAPPPIHFISALFRSFSCVRVLVLYGFEMGGTWRNEYIPRYYSNVHAAN